MRSAAAACALLILVRPPQPAPSPTRTIHRHFTSADRKNGRYQYVPFEVAPDLESITIGYRYSGDEQGAATIDLGLFEPGTLTFGTTSFRGYSGGAQRTVTVGRTTSSPGYRTGALPAGTWHVLLGLYKVPAEGVDVEIDIIESRRPQPPADPRAPTARIAGSAPSSISRVPERSRWYAGGLHIHTNHSDGTIAPGKVAAMARDAGLDFIAITDHNTTTWTREPMPAAPLAIVGEEVTTPAGHANVWGLDAGAWVDFRVEPNDEDAARRINRLVSDAHGAGALFSLNHPFGECGGCAWEQVIPDAFDALEIWNGEAGPQQPAIALWDRLLRAGRHVTAVGASDWHRAPAPIGAAAVRVFAAGLSSPALLSAIRDGHAIVMRDATTTPPEIAARCGTQVAAIGDTLRCGSGDAITVSVTANGIEGARADLVVNGLPTASAAVGAGTTFTTSASPGYLRVHVLDRHGDTVAVTNPVHVATR